MANTNPRKFSEKIAQHIEKQRQETEAFDQIMREVMGVSRTPGGGQPPGGGGPGEQPRNQQHLLHASMPAYRGGSLPDINNMPHNHHHHGDKSQGGQVFQRSSSPRSSSKGSIGPMKGHKPHRTDAPYASPPSLSMLNQAMGGGNAGGNMQGMYTTNYLSPPGADAPWRRANSDSALHSPLHSLMIPSVVPDSSEESSNNSNDPRDNYGLSLMDQSSKQQDPSSVIPNTVGDGPNLLEIIPSSVSTGSLPDLTNFQFTPPLQQPIDAEDSQLTNSPYSTSPISLTYSPTGGSPHPPPNTSNNQQHQVVSNQRTSQGVPRHQHQQNQGAQQVQLQHQQHQQHQSQAQQQQPLQSNSQGQQQQQQPQMMDNPLNVNVTSFQNYSPNDNNMLSAAYRIPQRPSPESSPLPFRSPSPLDGQLSAPSSPGGPPQIQNSAESFYLSQQANALQQHFEQITMIDPGSSPQRNSNHWQGGQMVNNSPYFYNSGQQQQILTGVTAGIPTLHSPQHHQPQTPQTPTSIPDIIFTDFNEDLLANEAQALREGLGPIDMDGFNMLADPDLVQLDPQAEDSFRLDRL